MKGRKPDHPALQVAKGCPRQRLTKAERQIAEAEAMAQLMVAPEHAATDPLAPPQFLDDRFAPALAAWKEYAPLLAERKALDRMFRHTFALFCVWLGELVIANEDIAKNGYSKLVKTVSGDRMPRKNHSVERRDEAMKWVMQLSERFGFTPLDRYKLEQQHQAWAARMPAQPNELPLGVPGSVGDEPQASLGDVIGIGAQMGGRPPDAKPN